MATQRPPRAAVRAAVRAALADLEPGDRVVVALSGGPDSLALAAAAAVVGAEQGLVVEALVVDHGMQRDSARTAARAADQARVLGCHGARVEQVQVDRGPAAGGLEAAARAARYGALEAFADGERPDRGGERPDPGGGAARGVPPARAILLGHTRDDQAETVLLGLARGSGTRSLSGMAPIAGRYRRPLLGLPRAVVQAAALAAAQEDPRLTPWHDPHNVDGQFARVRVRGEVLPVLEESLGPGIAAALARTAQLARQDADALDQWADQVWAALQTPPGPAPGPSAPKRPNDRPEGAPGHDPCGLPGLDSRERARIMIGADAAPLPAGTPIAVVSRVVRRFLIGAGCPAQDLTAEHVARVVGLLCADAPSRAEVALPGGIRARREEGALVVRA